MLEKLRSGEPLTVKEKQIHDQPDAAVVEAYGWRDLKEAPHSCGASECAAIEKREALLNDTHSHHDRSVVAPYSAFATKVLRFLTEDRAA